MFSWVALHLKFFLFMNLPYPSPPSRVPSRTAFPVLDVSSDLVFIISKVTH